MKTKAALATVASLLLAGSAHAASLAAAWDFAQQAGVGTWGSGGGFFPVQTLAATYSDFDPEGAGIEAANFGTLFMDGSNGSDLVNNTDFNPATDQVIASNLALTVNADAPNVFLGNMSSGAALNQLGAEGVCLEGGFTCNGNITFQAQLAFDAVFQADVSSVGTASNWELNFAKQNANAGSTDVLVEWGFDGSTFGSSQLVTFADTESLTTIALGGVDESDVFVRFSFSGANAGFLPNIDNVSLSADVATVPEPGTVLLGLAGLAGLGLFGRRRA